VRIRSPQSDTPERLAPSFHSDVTFVRSTSAPPAPTMTATGEVRVIEIQSLQTHASQRTSDCSICGGTVRVNPLKSVDTDVICKKCRCRRCSIPMSDRLCRRCGVAHGTPSTQPGLCVQCCDKTSSDAYVDEDHDEHPAHAPMWSAIA